MSLYVTINLCQCNVVIYAGAFWNPYPHWKTIKSFILSSLRDDGLGKRHLETRILEEIDIFCETFIESNLKTPIDLGANLPRFTTNIISQMVFGRRFEYDEKSIDTLISSILETFDENEKYVLASNVHFGKYFMKATLEKEIRLYNDRILATLTSYIRENKDKLNRDDPGCLIDRLLIKSEEAEGAEKKLFDGEIF